MSSHFGILQSQELIDNEMGPTGIDFNNKDRRRSTLKDFQPKLKEIYQYNNNKDSINVLENTTSLDSNDETQ